MGDTEPSQLDRVRRRGARLGIAAFATFVASFTLIWSVQILLQVWAPAAGPGSGPADCREGIRELISAVERARREAATETAERRAVARFRRTLQPAWARRPRLDALCALDEAARRALAQVDEFRYAEEREVGRNLSVVQQRRRARDLYRELSRGKATNANQR